MAEQSDGNKWDLWKKYVEDMARDIRELREKIVVLRIDLAVTKTKIAIYVSIICFIISLLVNLGFVFIRTKV